MRRITVSLLTLLVAAGLVFVSPLTSRGAGSAPPVVIADPLAASPQPTTLAAPLTVMLEVAAPPLAMAEADQRAAVATAQAQLDARLQALGIPVLFTTRAAYLGTAVSATPAQLATLRTLPGLAGVHVIPPKERAATTIAATGAGHFWSALEQRVLGQGVRVGIIDSGIDYTHATFGGPGTPAAFAANNPALVEPGSFPTAKVAGGADFAGDAYDASGIQGSPLPVPDADPLDCGGHGTQVASIAAGYGVDAAGAVYRGLYSRSVSFERFVVPPGIAPEANLVALKIFGCRGTTTLLTQAIDYALDPNGDGNTTDRLVDVLNISLGTPFGPAGDPDAVAVDRAVQAGVVVVVAAGGAGSTASPGDVFYSVASPAATPLAIAVGASAEQAGATRVASFSPRGPSQSAGALTPDLLAPGVDVGAAAVGSGNGAAPLTGTSAAAPQVAGAAALLHQLHPSWSPARIKTALLNTTSPVAAPNGTLAPPSLAGGGQLDLAPLPQLDLLAYAADTGTPALTYGAPLLDAPLTLRRELAVENTGDIPRTVQIETITAASENGVQLEAPSSIRLQPGEQARVPVDLTIQPQLLDNTPDAATTLRQSQGLYRYYLAEHSGYLQLSAHSGARVRLAYVADYAAVEVWIGGTYVGTRLDRGELSPYISVNPGSRLVEVRRVGAAPGSTPLFSAEITVEEGRDHTAVLWGCDCKLRLNTLVERPDTAPAGSGLVTFHNSYPYAHTAVDLYSGDTLLAANLPQGEFVTVPVPAGQHTFRALRAGTPQSRSPLATQSASVVEGQQFLLAFTRRSVWTRQADNAGGDTQRVRVPFQVFPRAASQSSVSASSFLVPAGVNRLDLPLQNTGARNAPFDNTSPRAQVALVSAFELDPLGVSPLSPSLTAQTRYADLAYAGATSNAASTGDVGSLETYVYFGVATQAAWASPNQVEFRVSIDTNQDNTPDFLVMTASRATLTLTPPNLGPPDDVFITALYRIPPGQSPQYTGERTDWNTLSAPTARGFETEGLDPVAFNTRVVFLGARAPSLGLSATNTRVRYYVETFVRGIPADRVPASGFIEYDVAGEAITPVNLVNPAFKQRPLFVATTGATLSTAVNQSTLGERGTQALLLLHHHNPLDTQVQIVTLVSSQPLGLRAKPEWVRSILPVVNQ
jgi:subtilisin family serine protease